MKKILKHGQQFYSLALLDSTSAADYSLMLKHHLHDYQR